jgi:hypothetical protein
VEEGLRGPVGVAAAPTTVAPLGRCGPPELHRTELPLLFDVMSVAVLVFERGKEGVALAVAQVRRQGRRLGERGRRTARDGMVSDDAPLARLVEDGAQQKYVAVGGGGRSNRTMAWLCAAKGGAIFANVQLRK